MDWYPLIADSLTTQPAAGMIEQLVVNPFDHPDVPAIVGSLAGFEYQLPPMGQLRPVVRLRALTLTQLAVPVDYANSGGLKTSANYADWFVTLREPTGAFICKDAPLQQFVQDNPKLGSPNRVLYPRFSRSWWIDPRQSFVYCTADNLGDLVVLEFTYQ